MQKKFIFPMMRIEYLPRDNLVRVYVGYPGSLDALYIDIVSTPAIGPLPLDRDLPIRRPSWSLPGVVGPPTC